jgi:hypothetical protein
VSLWVKLDLSILENGCWI